MVDSTAWSGVGEFCAAFLFGRNRWDCPDAPMWSRSTATRSGRYTPGGGIYLSDDARTALIKAWEDHKESEIVHGFSGARWADG